MVVVREYMLEAGCEMFADRSCFVSYVFSVGMLFVVLLEVEGYVSCGVGVLGEDVGLGLCIMWL